MGFRISYVTAPVPPAELAAALSLPLAGDSADMPGRGPWVAQIRATGWSVLWADDLRFVALHRPALLALSERAEVITCEIDETTMWCAAECLTGGASLWRVAHAGDGGNVHDLTVDGTPPESLARHRSAREAEQAAEDPSDPMMVDFIFEIPQDLAGDRSGFRQDEGLEPDQVGRFHRIAFAEPPRRKGWFAGLFGRS